jgi:hypothetical protein
MVVFGELHVFLQLSEYAYLEQNEPFSTWNTIICRKYSYQKLTQFSQGNHVLDAHASNTDGFLSRDTSFLQLS